MLDLILWRNQFPPNVMDRLVSHHNPTGSINNSELKLAGIIGNNDVLANVYSVVETTTATRNDNLSGLSWSTKGAVLATTPASYLLCFFAIHQQKHCYQQRNFYVPCPSNGMADNCLWLWHLNDTKLLTSFNSHYSQSRPWQLCHLSTETASAITFALLYHRCSLKATPRRATCRLNACAR